MRRTRRNSDDRIRLLERTFEASGSSDDLDRLLSEVLRHASAEYIDDATFQFTYNWAHRVSDLAWIAYARLHGRMIEPNTYWPNARDVEGNDPFQVIARKAYAVSDAAWSNRENSSAYIAELVAKSGAQVFGVSQALSLFHDRLAAGDLPRAIGVRDGVLKTLVWWDSRPDLFLDRRDSMILETRLILAEMNRVLERTARNPGDEDIRSLERKVLTGGGTDSDKERLCAEWTRHRTGKVKPPRKPRPQPHAVRDPEAEGGWSQVVKIDARRHLKDDWEKGNGSMVIPLGDLSDESYEAIEQDAPDWEGQTINRVTLLEIPRYHSYADLTGEEWWYYLMKIEGSRYVGEEDEGETEASGNPVRRNGNVLPYYCPGCRVLVPADGLGNLPEACPVCRSMIPYYCTSCRHLVQPEANGWLPDACPCGEPVVFAANENLPAPVETLPVHDYEDVQRELELREEPKPSGAWWDMDPASDPPRSVSVPNQDVSARRRGRRLHPRYVIQIKKGRRYQVPICAVCSVESRLERTGGRSFRCPRCQTVHTDPT